MQQEKSLVVRRRRGEEQDLRRGSIKSRIFQMSKRRKKEQPAVSYPETPRDNSVTGRSDQYGIPDAPGASGILGSPQTFKAGQVTRSRQTPDSLQLTRSPSTRPGDNQGEPRVPPREGQQALLGFREGRLGNGQGITHRGPVFRTHLEGVNEQGSKRGDPHRSAQTDDAAKCDPPASPVTHQGATPFSPAQSPIYAVSTKRRAYGPTDVALDPPSSSSTYPKPFCAPAPPQDMVSPPSPPEVVLRTRSRKEQEPGHLLHSAISRHFRHLHCSRPPPHIRDSPASVQLSSNLEQYIGDLFHQLDPMHQGFVTREDFEALCEVLGITAVAQGRNSMEWLSSYQPRPHTPGSPLRMDRLGEARYPGPRPPSTGPSPSFLWTQGPRPFWELWSARKGRRKQLSLTEFTERLLEQWAASHGYPVQEARRLLRSKALQRPPKVFDQLADVSKPFEERDGRRRHLLERLGRRTPVTSASGQTNTNGNNGLFYPARNGSRPGNGKENGFRENELSNGRFQPRSTANKLSGFFLKSRKEQLEQQMVGQNAQIADLKDVIEDLRSSLQLSDAQNLALQVALKRMAKAESQLPAAEKSHQYEAKVQKSEKQLENLISELKEMSQTRYPTLSSQNCSTSSSSQEHEHPQLATTQLYLSGVQKELRGIATRLSGSPSTTIKDLSLAEAFDALVEAQAEIEKMRFWKQRNNVALISLLIHRSNLEAAEAALAATESSLKEKETELKEARLSLTDTTIRLNESERNINHLQENRWSKYQECSPQRYSHIRKSLLQELKAAKEVLISSLKNVHDLELESRKVPKLEAQIHHLENKIARRRSQFY